MADADDASGQRFEAGLQRAQPVRRIDLTPLEFGFLQQLVAGEGRTVTRRELLQMVWGYENAAAGSNVVEAVARSVRRKLGDRARMLETVRGLGYRMRAG